MGASAAQLAPDDPWCHVHLVGRSPAMVALRERIRRLAPLPAPVPILGETGTGKQGVARALHLLSPRRTHPFVGFDFAALPPELAARELFGHGRGAYTGAITAGVGLLGAVGEGTLLLDEIGDASLDMQRHLLRVLQERTFRRLGETAEQPFQGRIAAATHADLPALVAAGRFRADLWYRLRALAVHVPPLRERREDVPAIALDLLARHAVEFGRTVIRIEAGAIDLLCAQPWPGNVRELDDALQAALVLGTGPVLRKAEVAAAIREWEPTPTLHQPARTRAPRGPGQPPKLTREEADAALAQHAGNKTAAAKALGVSPKTLRAAVRRDDRGS